MKINLTQKDKQILKVIMELREQQEEDVEKKANSKQANGFIQLMKEEDSFLEVI